jgi:predicted nucleic acid-binding protein
MRQSFMSFKYVIDASTWIEYFKASRYGEVAKKYIESEDATTPTIVVSEVSRKLQKEIELGNETQQGRLNRLEFISATNQIVDLDFEIAVEAGKTDLDIKRKVKGWSLADSIVLCTAKNAKGKVITGDEHFRELDDVIFIKE